MIVLSAQPHSLECAMNAITVRMKAGVLFAEDRVLRMRTTVKVVP